ncbi:MAG: hypothetical protein ACD_7C00039G0013 [uncultured bacterium]|nr:MAG: hypothetical protein ACD_7C00039G0013 [uncultured bacterium]
MLRYFIKTFGCQMNFSDSERMASFLESHGLKPTKEKTNADLVIFNSCGVRKMPEDRAFGQIHNLRKNNPRIKIVLTGCIVQRKDVQKILAKKVDLFFPIKDIHLLENFIYKNFEIKNYKSTQKKINYLSTNPKYTNTFSASIPIMTGCNNFCAYCVVPYARGREISRPADEILEEIKELIKKGYKEITLLGQNVNSYHSPSPLYSGDPPANAVTLRAGMSRTRDRGGVINFSDLLKAINNIPGDFWIRFLSSHPKDMSDELIETVTTLDKVCESIHLPIQSGDNVVLENMNRKYTRDHYLKLIEKIKEGFKKNKPGAIFSLSSDIIVGFAGETKIQLEKSAQVMRKAKYDMVYFGQFSPRPQTVAWLMKDNISKIEKERREKYLNEILKKTSLENNRQYLGKTFDVLVESQKEGAYFGKTRTFKNVKATVCVNCHPELVEGSQNLIGKFVKVKITKISTWNLEGEIK